jgi:hypothetical protein
MQAIADFKTLVLEMLEGVFQSEEVQATQQLGVNISNTVKREGVVIIQNQNVEIYARIMPALVKMLRLCDAVELNWPSQAVMEVEPQQKSLPSPVFDDDTDPVEACCRWLYENHINWQDMQDLTKARYLEYVIGRFRTRTEAANWLGIGSTYLCKLTKKAMNN